MDLLALHASYPERYPALLQSAATGTPQGRYDILFALPAHTLWLDSEFRLHGGLPGSTGFLDGLDRWWQEAGRGPAGPDWLPFRSGWFVYLGYELAAEIEPSLHLEPDPAWPVAFAARMRAAMVRDHHEGTVTLVAEEGQAVFDEIQADLDGLQSPDSDKAGVALSAVSEEPAGAFIDAVESVKRRIEAGDIYQANLSRSWSADVYGPVGDAELFRRLRTCNPGPFAGLARWGANAIISSSPERLVRVRGERVDTRPIAGTRPRGASAERDKALTRELIGHPKERAEHIMLIDLERNDLGRVCEPGTVEVDEYMILETYAHVHHIVSNVTGRLRKGVTPGEVIAAVFPGGTITGCPKVRCMEIIDELEATPRGPYTGSFGYLDRSGDMDLNILIRTLSRSGRHVGLRAGAGIVADSVAKAEVEETRAKARGLLLALGADVI